MLAMAKQRHGEMVEMGNSENGNLRSWWGTSTGMGKTMT